MNYRLSFTDFMSQSPAPRREQFAEWNRQRVLACIESGDYINARVYTIELVRWSL